MDVRKSKVGILLGSPAHRDAQGRVWVNHAIGRLCESIRQRSPETSVCLSFVGTLEPNLNHVLRFPEERIVALPPLKSTISAQKHFCSARSVIRRFVASVDCLLIRLPFQLPWILRHLNKPKLLHIVGNPVGVIQNSTDYKGVMRLLAHGFARHSEAEMKRLIKEPRTRVCTNGREMWERLGCQHGRIVVSSCLWREESQPRDDFSLHHPPRLLFVGYLRPEKGATVLIDAFEQVRETRPLRLTLVGGSDRQTSAENQIKQRIAASRFRDDISIVGMVNFGEDLFDLYRNHDIFVQPSLSEGTPRTIVEARAFGCPVVASRVGGIPDSIRSERDGLLVEPGCPFELAAAIARLLDDEEMRLGIIREGLAHCHKYSLEAFADVIVDEIAKL